MSPAADPKRPAEHVTPHGRVPPEGTPEWPPLWGHDSIQEENPFLSAWSCETGNQIQNRTGGEIRVPGLLTHSRRSLTPARFSLHFHGLESPGQGSLSWAV